MSIIPEPKSRRNRPAKAPLSREWIIEETIKIMQSEGLEKATMRRVAAALDTGAASLYVYVANTAELHAAVLDQLIGSLKLAPGGKKLTSGGKKPGSGGKKPGSSGDWQHRLESLLNRYAAVLDKHPGLAKSALVLRPTGANAVRLYDSLLGLLLEGGIPVDRAAWGVDLLLHYVTSTVAEHSASTPSPIDKAAEGEEALRALDHAFRDANPRTTPHIVEHADALLSGTPDQRMTWAIQALLAGIADTPTPNTEGKT